MEEFDLRKYLAEGKLLKEEELFSNRELVDSASSIEGDRIIATTDDFGDDSQLPPESTIETIAIENNVGYLIKKYSGSKAVIFYSKSNPLAKKAVGLYNKYMKDYSSVSNEEHIMLGGFFGYDSKEVQDWVDDLTPKANVGKQKLKPQSLFQSGGGL